MKNIGQKKEGKIARKRIFTFKVDKTGTSNISVSGGGIESIIGPFNTLQEVKDWTVFFVKEYGYKIITPAWGSDKDVRKDIGRARSELGLLRKYRNA